MQDLRLALNDRTIAGLKLACSGQYFARDTELPGLIVLVGKRPRPFWFRASARKVERDYRCA